MPSLDKADRDRLLIEVEQCRECNEPIRRSYCRSCDDFFTVGHLRTCKHFAASAQAEHETHRTYYGHPPKQSDAA